MNIHVEYSAQSRLCAGCSEESFQIEEGAGLVDLLKAIAERHGAAMRDLLFYENGALSRSMLYFVDDEQADAQMPCLLTDGARVSLLSPVSGG